MTLFGLDFASPYIGIQVSVIVWLSWGLFVLSYRDHKRTSRAGLTPRDINKMFHQMEFDLEYHNAIQTIYRNTLAGGHKTRLEGLVALSSLGGLKYHVAHGHYYFYSDDGGFFTRIPEAHIQTR